ncbi:MAG: helix-turn-helix transcriptional regulator [Sphingobacteriales bacterium]|nr:helix-turn-helix transcriptional regulator [Sphingobacteriales bacterium]
MSIKNTDKLSTEAKILAAAEQVFLRSGYDGSRMQEIADLAGINKAMLHYYFRSKDLLFERIFEQKFISFFLKYKNYHQVLCRLTIKYANTHYAHQFAAPKPIFTAFYHQYGA